MSPSIRSNLSKSVQFLARYIGARICDARNGRLLGRAFMLTWRGRLYLLGYSGPPLVPMFIPQPEITYSRQALGFTTHAEVDYERL